MTTLRVSVVCRGRPLLPDANMTMFPVMEFFRSVLMPAAPTPRARRRRANRIAETHAAGAALDCYKNTKTHNINNTREREERERDYLVD